MRSRLEPAPPLYDARARYITYFSPALRIEKHYYIYLPPEHEASSAPLPALYLLRGHESEWVNGHQDASRGGTNAIDVYLRLRAAGALGPLILVMPGTASADNQVPGVVTNMRAPQLAVRHRGVGTGRFEDAFMQDLLAHVEATFGADPGRRAVDGFSLGGLMAIKLAAQYPHQFCSAGAYDGTFLYAEAGGRSIRLHDRVIHNPMFDAVWGRPRNTAHIAANSPANLILRGDQAALARIQWLISAGPEAAEPWDSNYYRAQYLLGILVGRGLVNSHPQPIRPDGQHSWRTADAHLAETLPLHYQRMSTSSGWHAPVR